MMSHRSWLFGAVALLAEFTLLWLLLAPMRSLQPDGPTAKNAIRVDGDCSPILAA
jgi:hypothetical protein